MLAMVVNDNAGCLTPRGVLASIASRLAPTVESAGVSKPVRQQKAPKADVYGKLRDHNRRFRDPEPLVMLRVGIKRCQFCVPRMGIDPLCIGTSVPMLSA